MYNTDHNGIDRECIFESAKEPQCSITMPGTLNKISTISLLTKVIPEASKQLSKWKDRISYAHRL